METEKRAKSDSMGWKERQQLESVIISERNKIVV